MRARDARKAAAAIRAMLDRVERGELDASPGMVRALRGSLAALDALSSGRGAR